MTIFVTGATGFVGSRLVQRLVREGHRVRVLRRVPAATNDSLPRAIETIIGDITSAAAVDRAVAGCEVVFHSAALIQYAEERNVEQTAVNVGGTQHVVDACLRHGVQRLIHVSSIAAVGATTDGTLLDETSPYNLARYRVNYADTKYAAEQVVHAGVQRGLDAVLINPGTIYGAGDRRRVGYIRGMTSCITSCGGMSVVDVQDVVEGAIRAWQRGETGERYILIAENHAFQVMGRMFAEPLGRSGPRVVLPAALIRLGANCLVPLQRLFGERWRLTPAMARMAHLTFYFNNRKSREQLGMTYRPLCDTVHETVHWLREQRFL